MALRACRLQRRAEAPRRALLVAPVWPPARDQNLASARCRRARTCAGRRVSGIPRWPEGHSLRGSEVVAVECGAELGVRYDAHCFLQSAAAFNFRGLGGRFWSASGLQPQRFLTSKQCRCGSGCGKLCQDPFPIQFPLTSTFPDKYKFSKSVTFALLNLLF